jgi:hypothetical protein
MPRSDDENGRWLRWYAVVLGSMAAMVALFAYLSAHYK